jgi:hypothetical protein
MSAQRGWWRRNAIGLAAFLVLAPATVAITFSTEFGSYASYRPSQPVEVAAGETADFAGSDWRLESAERYSAESPRGEAAGLPGGTDLVVATLTIEPGELDDEGRSPGCTVRLDEVSAGDVVRSWGDAAFSDLDHETAEGSEATCDPELTEPYRAEWIFLVPSDAGEQLALEVQVVGELPRYLHLALAPLPAS